MATSTDFATFFNNRTQTNIPQEFLISEGDRIENGYMVKTQESVATLKRNGLSLLIEEVGSAQAIDGMYWWEAKGIQLFTSGSKVYKIINESGTFEEIGDTFNGGQPKTVWADNGDITVFTRGNRLFFTDGNTISEINSPGSPDNASHVVFLNFFLITFDINEKSIIRFADFFDATAPTFNSLDAFSSEADSDKISSIVLINSDLYIFGTQSTEFWYNSNEAFGILGAFTFPFSRYSGATRQIGTMTPHSHVRADGDVYFLDSNRRLRRGDNKKLLLQSTDYDRFIQDLDDVGNTTMDYVTQRGRRLIKINFLNADVTLWYDLDLELFYEITFWDNDAAIERRFLGSGP